MAAAFALPGGGVQIILSDEEALAFASRRLERQDQSVNYYDGQRLHKLCRSVTKLTETRKLDIKR